MRFPHTHYRKGTRVWIRLRDGTEFYDTFVDRISRFVVVERRGRVRTNTIAAMGYGKRKVRNDADCDRHAVGGS